MNNNEVYECFWHFSEIAECSVYLHLESVADGDEKLDKYFL